MRDFSARLRALVGASHGGSVNAAAGDIGIPNATLARIVAGTVTSPRADALRKIESYYDASVDWLILGGEQSDAERALRAARLSGQIALARRESFPSEVIQLLCDIKARLLEREMTGANGNN